MAVANRINDLQSVLRTTEDHSLTQLQEIGQEIDTWQTKVRVSLLIDNIIGQVYTRRGMHVHVCIDLMVGVL